MVQHGLSNFDHINAIRDKNSWSFLAVVICIAEMGLTGELVKSVFSRSRITNNESNVRSNNVEKRRWRHVRSYLCGDEFNSVLAEEDSISVKSSEVTVTQPLHEDQLTENGDTKSEDTVEIMQKDNTGFESKSMHEAAAAMIIQTAVRDFLSRRKLGVIGFERNGNQELKSAGESPSTESLGTSVEVQTGNSTEAFSNERDKIGFQSLMQHKARTLAKKKKEDWDDSPLSSSVLKTRIQNKLEAMTRRERTLAYAFSQQLRICSKKNPTKWGNTESNIGWSLLERWMATRNPENSSMESYGNKQSEMINLNQQRITFQKTFSEFVTGEEKESCGSNEVPVQVDDVSVTSPEDKGSCSPSKTSIRKSGTVSRRKTGASSHSMKEYGSKTGMRDYSSKARENVRKKHRPASRKQKGNQAQ